MGYGHGLEFIHANSAGPGGVSDTYTICRVGVPRARLVREVQKGFHPHYQIVHVDGRDFVRRKPGAEEVERVNQDGPWVCAAQTEAQRTREGSYRNLVRLPPCEPNLELIHGEQSPRDGRNRSYTVCRLAVPRERLLQEISEGMHPGYSVTQESGVKVPQPNHHVDCWSCAVRDRAR